ncbi:hypothetical protein RUM43_010855 [Polyplax serrata]|uniref:Uncharacterized protein n=1 Tax=Polyplax serrata TaxID=468196 RepID=A0AAN8PTX9_POLSC
MLSVLIVCIGVIEALSCFEHFRYGIVYGAAHIYENIRRGSTFLTNTSKRLLLGGDDRAPLRRFHSSDELTYAPRESKVPEETRLSDAGNKSPLQKADKIDIVKRRLERQKQQQLEQQERRRNLPRSYSLPEVVYTKEDLELTKIINELAIEPISEETTETTEIDVADVEVAAKEFDILFDEVMKSTSDIDKTAENTHQNLLSGNKCRSQTNPKDVNKQEKSRASFQECSPLVKESDTKTNTRVLSTFLPDSSSNLKPAVHEETIKGGTSIRESNLMSNIKTLKSSSSTPNSSVMCPSVRAINTEKVDIFANDGKLGSNEEVSPASKDSLESKSCKVENISELTYQENLDDDKHLIEDIDENDPFLEDIFNAIYEKIGEESTVVELDDLDQKICEEELEISNMILNLENLDGRILGDENEPVSNKSNDHLRVSEKETLDMKLCRKEIESKIPDPDKTIRESKSIGKVEVSGEIDVDETIDCLVDLNENDDLSTNAIFDDLCKDIVQDDFNELEENHDSLLQVQSQISDVKNKKESVEKRVGDAKIVSDTTNLNIIMENLSTNIVEKVKGSNVSFEKNTESDNLYSSDSNQQNVQILETNNGNVNSDIEFDATITYNVGTEDISLDEIFDEIYKNLDDDVADQEVEEITQKLLETGNNKTNELQKQSEGKIVDRNNDNKNLLKQDEATKGMAELDKINRETVQKLPEVEMISAPPVVSTNVNVESKGAAKDEEHSDEICEGLLEDDLEGGIRNGHMIFKIKESDVDEPDGKQPANKTTEKVHLDDVEQTEKDEITMANESVSKRIDEQEILPEMKKINHAEAVGFCDGEASHDDIFDKTSNNVEVKTLENDKLISDNQEAMVELSQISKKSSGSNENKYKSTRNLDTLKLDLNAGNELLDHLVFQTQANESTLRKIRALADAIVGECFKNIRVLSTSAHIINSLNTVSCALNPPGSKNCLIEEEDKLQKKLEDKNQTTNVTSDEKREMMKTTTPEEQNKKGQVEVNGKKEEVKEQCIREPEIISNLHSERSEGSKIEKPVEQFEEIEKKNFHVAGTQGCTIHEEVEQNDSKPQEIVLNDVLEVEEGKGPSTTQNELMSLENVESKTEGNETQPVEVGLATTSHTENSTSAVIRDNCPDDTVKVKCDTDIGNAETKKVETKGSKAPRQNGKSDPAASEPNQPKPEPFWVSRHFCFSCPVVIGEAKGFHLPFTYHLTVPEVENLCLFF